MKRSKLVDTSVDVASLRRAYSHLFKLPLKIFEGNVTSEYSIHRNWPPKYVYI